MTKSREGGASDRIQRSLEEYVRALDSGTTPDVQDYLDQMATAEERAELRQLLLEARALEHLLPEPLEEGQTVDGVALGRELGRGGMGVVQLGWEPDGTAVAVKRLPEELLFDAAAVRRFDREIDALARLRAPHVVPTLRHGRTGERRYLVMPFLSGGSLADRIRERRQAEEPPDETELRRTVADLAKVCRAAHAAHGAGLVHRDIKPSNVLYDAAGEPHLADFGLVHLTGGSTLTTGEKVLGTAAYLAPERLLEAGRDADPRVDVFSLGVTLFEALTGARPFQGTLPEIVAATRRGPPALSVFLGHAPPRGLDALLERALADRPRQRYASAAALADDLETWLAGGVPAAVRGARRRRLVRLARRYPLRAGALVALLSLALGTAGWAGWSTARTRARIDSLARSAEAAAERFRALAAAEQALVLDGMDGRSGGWRWNGFVGREHDTCQELAEQVAARIAKDDPDTEEVAGALMAELDLWRTDARERARLRTEALRELETAALAWRAAARLDESRGELREALASLYAESATWHDALGREVEGAEAWRQVVEDHPSEATELPDCALAIEVEPRGAEARVLRFARASNPWSLEPVPGHQDLRSPARLGGLPPGSYLVVLRRPGGAREVRVPVVLRRGRTARVADFELPPEELLDDGWAWIAPGAYLAGGDPQAVDAEERELRSLPAFWIAERELTCGEYREFLLDLLARDEKCLVAEDRDYVSFGWRYDVPPHVPREGSRDGPCYTSLEELREGPRTGYFRDECALHGIAPRDAQHYVRWRNERARERGEPWVYSLPTGDQWEKAARGVDGRPYAWGGGFDWSWTGGGYTQFYVPGFKDSQNDNTGWGHFVPGSFPLDRSPYGLLDTVGNVREICTDRSLLLDRYLVRGGEESFYAPDSFRLASRHGAFPFEVNWDFGLRLVRVPREDR